MDTGSGRSRAPPPPIVVCQPEVDPAGNKAATGVPAMSVHHRWLEYRDERTSSSSSDSGVVVQLELSPPIGAATLPGTSSSPSPLPASAFSPPGLSPLTVHDSAFSTPTSTTSRFTFDHVPFSRNSGKDLIPSAFDVPSTSKHTDSLQDVLKQVRGELGGHQPLERKQSVIQSPKQISPLLSGSLSVTIGERPADRFTQALLSAHPLLSPSLSSDSLQPSPRSDKSPASASSETLDDDDKKQYYCYICNKDFRRPDILSRHLRRHTGEKPFGCDACGRFFSRSDHLRTHRRTHTDEKPYRCSLCPYAARRRDVLTRHMSTRHQSKPHNDLRRCLSDGDAGLATLFVATSPRRARHVTEATAPTSTASPRGRTLTEALRPRDECDFPSLNEIEDDVIVDVCDVVDENDDDPTPDAR